jgi:hypothetical protein
MAASNDVLSTEEEESFQSEDKDQPIPPMSVVAYNEQRACADLYRMYASGRLELQPDFQREVVWKPDERVRFIDSIVKNLPIPSMCFSLDAKTQKWKVIDGLQRMSSVVAFLGEDAWAMPSVNDVHPLLRNKTNIQLKTGSDEERRLYAAVEDVTIPVTVIRCDYEIDAHMRYLFMIFNRLNSGGVRLNNQEIRNCIYSGPFNTMLKEFDRTNENWHRLRRQIWGKMDRFRSVEILLRATAFSEALTKYDGNLAGFLNDYMLKGMKFTMPQREELATKLAFMATSADIILSELPGRKKSLTFVEGILVGILATYRKLSRLQPDQLRDKLTMFAPQYARLPSVAEGARYGLASASIVKRRLEEAMSLFATA